MRITALLALLSISFYLSTASAQLIQHLDATVETSIGIDADNLVTVWTDQSMAGNNAIAVTDSVFYLPAANAEELSWLDFGDTISTMQLFSSEASDSWLDQSAGNGGFCVLLAFRVNGIVDNWNDLFGNSTAVSQGFGLRYSSSGKIQAYLGGNTINKDGHYLSAGDIVIYAFNYNAATSTYELWDSKNYSSVSGSVAPLDFSLNAPVTIGATNSSSRLFHGWIGEVKVFDTKLNPSEFEAERDSMAMKWAGIELPMDIRWRVIPEDPRFPTEDVILAAISIGEEGFNNPLPADPENSDCTATFQEALDMVGSKGGGTVFVPEGHYRLDGQLHIPNNVTLRGRWRALSESEPAIGTIIKTYYGRDKETLPAFIAVAGSGGVRDLTFWHPEQSPGNIVPYPFVIEPNGGPLTIENITLINAYQGVNMSKASMCFIDNIQGTPLKVGFFADRSYAVSRFDKLNFGPEFWRWAKLPDDTPLNMAYETYMMSNGMGIDIREMDGFHLTEPKVRGMNIGLQFDVGVTGDNPHGDMFGLDLRDCNIGLRINSAKSLKIANSYMEGKIAGLQNLYHRTNIQMNNCIVAGETAALQNTSGGNLNISSSILDGMIHSSGSVSVTASNFINTGTDINLTSSTSSALIVGCEFSDGPDIINNAPSANLIIEHELQDDRYSPTTLLPPKDLSIRRKPSKYVIFNIEDFGAVADDGSDDSQAFGQAIDAANSNSGGIVFVPDGIFHLSGAYSLSPGVELRGASGSRHKSTNGTEHSMLQITGGEGNPDGDPFLTLGANSGVRGLTFYYPAQEASMILPETLHKYPFTIRGSGYGVYVTDCMLANPYQAVNFVNADDHLLENCFLGGLNKTIYVQNCDGGRVENFHLKPDFWRDLKMGDYPVTGDGTSQLKRYVGKYLHGIWLENSSNQVVYNIFNHASHQFFRADNSSGIGFMIGGEQLQRGYRFSGAEDFSLILSQANTNSQGDRSGSYGFWSDEDFSGRVTSWMCNNGGTATISYRILSGEFNTQQCGVGGSSGRGAVSLVVGKSGRFLANATNFSMKLTVDFDPESYVSIQESSFSELPNVLFRDTVSVFKRNTFTSSIAIADMNQDTVINQGLVLDDSNLDIQDSYIHPDPDGTIYDVRVLKGARSTDGEYRIGVTDKDYLHGSNNPLEIYTYYLIDTDCQINVYYKSESGRKLGKSYSYSGASDPSYKSVKFTASDISFDGSDDIIITVSGESPLLNCVSVSRDIRVFNLAPEWASDTFYLDKAHADLLFTAQITIGEDITDPENDPIQFSKVSGPAWLSISREGALSGIPVSGDEGESIFVVQAEDGQGNQATATLRIKVNSTTSTALDVVEKVFVYPVPAVNLLRIEGLSGEIHYQVYSLSGIRIMEAYTVDNSIPIDRLAPGSYILKLGERVFNIIKN